jgi:hypothetical protein
MKISHSSFRTVLAGPILAAALLFPAHGRADQLNGSVGSAGNSDGNHFTLTHDNSGGSIAGGYAGNYGSATLSISYGSVVISSHAFKDGTGTGYYGSGGSWVDTYTINPSNPALLGTPGTARFSYSFDGTYQAVNDAGDNISGWFVNLDTTGYSLGPGGNDGGSNGTISLSHTLTEDVGFTFGTPFSMTVGVNATSKPGIFNSSVDAQLSLRETGLRVLSGGAAVGYSSSARTGSAGAAPVANGASYAGFNLTNTSPYGHGSTASILGGVASTDSVVEATFLAQAAGFTMASDIVDLKGLGSDKHVLQMSYDPAIATSLFGSEGNAALLWLDPVSGLFKSAVFGNSDGGAQSQAFTGAFDANTENVLGDYGIDTTNHVVWAVVDHNSEFAVGQAAPEPGTSAMLFGGISLLALYRRKRAGARVRGRILVR